MSLFVSFPKEKPGVFARWKGIGHGIMKALSVTINFTVLTPCPVSYNHVVSWPRRSFSLSPALIYITKQHTGKRKREMSDYGKSATLILTKMPVWKNILKISPKLTQMFKVGAENTISWVFLQKQVFYKLNYDTKRLETSRNYIFFKRKKNQVRKMRPWKIKWFS